MFGCFTKHCSDQVFVVALQYAVNRMVAKYPNLKRTESKVYQLQSNYVSQYNVKNIEREDNEMEFDSNHNKKKDSDLDSEDDDLEHDKNYNLRDSDDEANRWCLCQQPSIGKMIKCDNRLCGIQWFHWKCVRIAKVPTNKWFCKSCRKYPTKSNLLHPKFIDRKNKKIKE